MMRILVSIFSIIILQIGNIVFAQEVQLKTSVNKTQVGLNETFEYKVEVSGQSTSLPNPSLPEFEGFQVVSGPSSSTNIQLVNGRMSVAKTYSYYLQPRRVGTLKIPPATMKIDDTTVSSNEITITVSRTSPKQTQPQKKTESGATDTEVSEESVFLKAIPSKREVYQNEQVTVTYKLYFRVPIRGSSLEKKPANTGFWTEEFNIPNPPPIESEVINGISYQVAVVRKDALFPTRSGKIELDPMVIALNVLVQRQRRSRSLFDSFFDDPFGRTVRKTVTTNPVVITVKPLPATGRPTNFSGEVGRYNMDLAIDKTELRANEAASVKLTLSGQGNIKLLKPPKLNLPSDMEVYDPEEKSAINRNKDIIQGSKTLEYIFVPRFAGEYKIQPITFSYFDPRLKQYKTLTSQPINLRILPGVATPGDAITRGNLGKQEVELLGEDIRFIRETASFFVSGTAVYKKWYYMVLYFVPVLGLIMVWNYAKQREKIRTDIKLARKRKAGKQASKHLAVAKKTMNQDSGAAFYREISRALQGFICDKLAIDFSDFNAQIAEEKLKATGIGDDVVQEYQDCLSESDFRQFAGGTTSQNVMKSFFDRVRKLMIQLEKQI